MIRLKIREAIESFNEVRPPDSEKLTVAKLAVKVYADRETLDKHKIILFYGLLSGKRQIIKLKWIEIICNVTGVTVDKLIEITNE
jgi:hypothetical protein